LSLFSVFFKYKNLGTHRSQEHPTKKALSPKMLVASCGKIYG